MLIFFHFEAKHNYKNDNLIVRVNNIISTCIQNIFTLIRMLQNFETLHLIYLENNNCMNYQELFNVRKYITLKSIHRVRQNLSSFNGLNWKTIPIFFGTTLPWGKNYLTKQYLKRITCSVTNSAFVASIFLEISFENSGAIGRRN